MKQTNIPPKFNIPWANGVSNPSYIRTVPDASSGVPGQASLQTGFPPETFVSVAAGGKPPWGADYNGVFKQITNLLIWAMAGGPMFYDATFSTAIGGYPAGAVLTQASGPTGSYWISLVDNNTSNPDGGGANWGSFSVMNEAQSTGHCHWRPTAEVLTGFVRCNKLTCGNGFSNASERANADCQNLFQWLWTNFGDTQCPMFDRLGASKLRGSFWLDDWNANYAICTPDMRGGWPGGTDTMGNTTAGRFNTATFTIGNSSNPGSLGNFVQPGSGNAAAFFQTGTWYVRL
jgi:hypothetical protein